jgi:hypothetical protein
MSNRVGDHKCFHTRYIKISLWLLNANMVHSGEVMFSKETETNPVLKSSQAISHVNAELKTNVSEISSVSIIRVDVVNDHMSLIFIPVCQTDPLPIGVLCSRRAESKCTVTHPTNFSPCCLTWCPCSQLFCFHFNLLFSVSWDFHDVCVLCLNKLKLGFRALLSLNPSSLFILSRCN